MEEGDVFGFLGEEQLLPCVVASEVEGSIDEDPSHTDPETSVQSLYTITLEDLDQTIR